MRIARVLVAAGLAVALTGCAVHPVRGCINRPVVCAAIGAAAVGGVAYLATQAEAEPPAP